VRDNKLTEKQMDYAESLIKENSERIHRHAPEGLPNYFKVDRIYRTLVCKTSKTGLGAAGKKTTIDRLLKSIAHAEKKEKEIQQKRDEFKAIANECIALGATAQEVLDYCKQNVCEMVKERALASYRGADYCEGFPGQYSDAYKTVAWNKRVASAQYSEINYIEKRLKKTQAAFVLIKPDWWLDIAKVYRKTLIAQKEDPENETEMD